MCSTITLGDFANLISIGTPIILLLWFYYSQKNTLSQNYFAEIDGIYAGFTEPTMNPEHGGRIYGGIIMHIRDTDGKGFFKGEFDFGERELFNHNNVPYDQLRTNGIFTFLGELNFSLHANKKRHPLRPNQNRKYTGTLYIVDRLDFDFKQYQIETYLCAEYDITHYREMQALTFTLRKIHRPDRPKLPSEFTLYRKLGASFEPYRNVKETVFHAETWSDR